MAHITGGGLTENLPRVLKENQRARLRKAAWPRPALFEWLQREGGVAEDEMHRVFNCGIGMALIVAPGDAKRAMDNLGSSGETVYEIGKIEASEGGASAIVT
jgi:phosphoribosylformylglycinamidine cyclo-ligase